MAQNSCHHTSGANHRYCVPRLTTASVRFAYKSEVPTTPVSGWINLLGQLTELRETLLFTSLLVDMVKDTDEQPDEEARRTRSVGVPSAGVSVPWSGVASSSCY